MAVCRHTKSMLSVSQPPALCLFKYFNAIYIIQYLGTVLECRVSALCEAKLSQNWSL